MPVWLRKTLAALSFVMFFGAGILSSFVFFPLLLLMTFSRERQRRVVTRLLGRSYPLFMWWLRTARLIEYPELVLPADLPRDRPYVLVANHPSLIDVLFCLGWLDGLTTVVKASWYSGWILRWVVGSTHYIPGAGLKSDGADYEPALERMVDALRAGRSVVTFPEGTRSPPHELLRFHRGPFEVACRANVLLLPLFIGIDTPGLTKGVPLPTAKMRYTFDWLPWVDCAEEGHEARKLKGRYHRLYQERQQRFLDELTRTREPAHGSANRADTAAPPQHEAGS
jgi:1-acyl-sn-glycerol-3-phosphate acyltransferase